MAFSWLLQNTYSLEAFEREFFENNLQQLATFLTIVGIFLGR